MKVYIAKTIGVALIIAGAVSVVAAIYYFFVMLGNVKHEKKWMLNWLAPVIVFLPVLWTEEGNKARLKLLGSILSFLICFFGSKFLLNFLDG